MTTKEYNQAMQEMECWQTDVHIKKCKNHLPKEPCGECQHQGNAYDDPHDENCAAIE